MLWVIIRSASYVSKEKKKRKKLRGYPSFGAMQGSSEGELSQFIKQHLQTGI